MLIISNQKMAVIKLSVLEMVQDKDWFHWPTKPVISLSLTQSAQTVKCIRTLKLAVKHLEFLHALWNIWSTVDENYSARGSNVFERASFLEHILRLVRILVGSSVFDRKLPQSVHYLPCGVWETALYDIAIICQLRDL